MTKGRPWKGTIAAVTVTLVALSPALAPSVAFASTETGQVSILSSPVVGTTDVLAQSGTGGSDGSTQNIAEIAIPFEATVTNPSAGGQYEYQVSVQDASGTNVDLSSAMPTIVEENGNPDMSVTGPGSDLAVYDSTTLTSTNLDSSGELGLMLPAGRYDVQISLVDTASPTQSQFLTEVSVPVTVESANVSNASSDATVSVPSGQAAQVSVTTDVYYPNASSSYGYQVQLSDSSGNPVDLSGQSVTVTENDASPTTMSWDASSQSEIAQSSALTPGTPSAAATFDLGTLSDGNYVASVSVMDSVYGSMGSTLIPIAVGSTQSGGGTSTNPSTMNVTGSVYQPMNFLTDTNSPTPVGGGTLDAMDSNGKDVQIPVKADGTFDASLPTDTYTLMSYTSVDGKDTLPLQGDTFSTSTKDLSVNVGQIAYLDMSQLPSDIEPNVATTIPLSLNSSSATVTNAVYLTAQVAQIQTGPTAGGDGTSGNGATTGDSSSTGNVMGITRSGLAALSATVGTQTVPFQWDASQNAYVSSSFSLPGGADSLPINVTFTQPGTYAFAVSMTDAVNGLNLGTDGLPPLTVGGATVTGSVYASDNVTPLRNEFLSLTDMKTGGLAWITADASGQFSTQLLDGNWTVQDIYLQDGSSTHYSDATTAPQIDVSNGTLSNGPIRIVDPDTVVGSVYADHGQTTPLADTYLEVQSASSTDSNAQGYSIVTDGNGQFVSALPTGSYVVTSEWNQDSGQYTQTSIPFQVSGGTVIVAPQPDNYDLTVEDSTGQPVQEGSSLIVEPGTQSNSIEPNWQTAQWLTIGATGQARGYLKPGTYTVIGISTPNNYYSISNETLDVTASSTLTKTISPPQPLLSGTLQQGTTAIPNATIVVMPASSNNDWSQAIYLATDSNGNFTDDGWNQDTNAYGDMLQPNTDYTIDGVWDENGTWYPLSQDLKVGATPSTVTVNLPTPDVTGSVTLDGTQVRNGWIGFDTPSDTDGSNWQWASIINGTYSITLPKGTYVVTSVGDNQGDYYDVQSAQKTVTIADVSQPQTDNLTFSNNFTGTLVSSTPVANATMMLSPVQNPQSQADWNRVQYVNTDANGKFQANLDPSQTWFLVGVWTQSGGYTQLDNAVPLQQDQTISIANNAAATVTFPSLPRNAYLVVKDPSGNFFDAQGQSTGSGNQMSFGFTLPVLTDGAYTVAGVVTEDTAGNETWTDLGSQSVTVTPVQSGTPTPVRIDLTASHSGSISGWATGESGYIVFQKSDNGSTQMTSVPFDSTGSFQTVFDGSSGWQVVGIETSSSYVAANGSFTNGTWTVTQGS